MYKNYCTNFILIYKIVRFYEWKAFDFRSIFICNIYPCLSLRNTCRNLWVPRVSEVEALRRQVRKKSSLQLFPPEKCKANCLCSILSLNVGIKLLVFLRKRNQPITCLLLSRTKSFNFSLLIRPVESYKRSIRGHVTMVSTSESIYVFNSRINYNNNNKYE